MVHLLPVPRQDSVAQQSVEQRQQHGERPHPHAVLRLQLVVAQSEIGHPVENYQGLIQPAGHSPPQQMEQGRRPYKNQEYCRETRLRNQNTRGEAVSPEDVERHRPDERQQRKPPPVAEGGQRQHPHVQHQNVGQQHQLVRQQVGQNQRGGESGKYADDGNGQGFVAQGQPGGG